MKRASYREAIRWIAGNDDTEWVNEAYSDGFAPLSVTAALVVDLFDADEQRVRQDIKRELNKLTNRRAA